MPDRTVQLVLQYDGSRFAGWQRQPEARTVQGELEGVLSRLRGAPVSVTGAGRTDAGVHALGQSAHVSVPDRWTPDELRRAINALLPADLWVARAHGVRPDFHARYSAVTRRYTYRLGTDEEARSPFRRPYEWSARVTPRIEPLREAAAAVLGEHQFRAFAVRGTAPASDAHRCNITRAEWQERAGGLDFTVEANRFLHHMVRFLVGSMVAVGAGRRSLGWFVALLHATDNLATAPPAPAHGLFLDSVTYSADLYLTDS